MGFLILNFERSLSGEQRLAGVPPVVATAGGFLRSNLCPKSLRTRARDALGVRLRLRVRARPKGTRARDAIGDERILNWSVCAAPKSAGGSIPPASFAP
jgi:hypothetical protein